jgi:hypothetical protein
MPPCESARRRSRPGHSGEIDLLFVGFNLREVGIVGEICGEVLGDTVLHVRTEIAVQVAADSRSRDVVTLQGRDAVRLDLQILRSRWRLQPDQRCGDRDGSKVTGFPDGGRNRREIRDLVLPLVLS